MTKILKYRKPDPGLTAVLIVLTLFLVSCAPSSFPERLPLEGNWYFKYDPENTGLQKNWHSSFRPGSGWETVPLGAYWSDDYDGVGWYQHQIWLPALRSDRNLALVITAVSDSATVWMNGEMLELHKTEETLLYADIRNSFRPESENLFVIQVVDTAGPGGLSGDVYIQKYIEPAELDGPDIQRDIAGL